MKTIMIGIGAASMLALGACGHAAPSADTRRAPTQGPRTTTMATTSTTLPRPTRRVDRLVSVAHGQLHLRCTGSGPVTVLLAGWDKAASTWGPFESAVATRTRACAYDRFGTGASPAPATNQTFAWACGRFQRLRRRV